MIDGERLYRNTPRKVAKSPVVEPGESDHRLTSSGEPSSPTATPESHILVHR